MFVMGCYGHKLSKGVLFVHHLILGVPGGSSHLAYRRRVPPGHNPHTRVNSLRYNRLLQLLAGLVLCSSRVLSGDRDIKSLRYKNHSTFSAAEGVSEVSGSSARPGPRPGGA